MTFPSKRAFHEEAPHNNKTFSLIWFVEYEFFCAHWNETAAFVAASWFGEGEHWEGQSNPEGKTKNWKIKMRNLCRHKNQQRFTFLMTHSIYPASAICLFTVLFFCFVENFPAYHILIINNNSMWIVLVLLAESLCILYFGWTSRIIAWQKLASL